MKRFWIAIFILSIANSTRGQDVATGGGPTVNGDAATDPIQACIDQKEKNKKGLGTGNVHNQAQLPIRSHPVENPEKELPVSCNVGQISEIKQALKFQLKNCEGKSESDLNKTFQYGCRMVTMRDYCVNTNRQMLDIARSPGITYDQFVKRTRDEFDWFKSDGRPRSAADDSNDPPKTPPGKNQFTSYYSPVMEASAVPTDEYKYPIYSAPQGLTHLKPDDKNNCGENPVTHQYTTWCIKNPDGTLSPTPTREEIYNGALKGHEIAYFKSLYDIQDLMVEGSGIIDVKQADGSVKRQSMNYDGQNGKHNAMLGSVNACQNKTFPQEGQKAYYDEHYNEAYTDTVHYNPSIVFFRQGDLKTSPLVGDAGLPITPNATIATDPENSIPTGAVVLLNGKTRRVGQNSCAESSTMAVAQDTGGAIKFAHIDRYMGEGKEAQAVAGSTNDAGDIFMAIPKGAGTPVPHCNYQSQPGP